MSSWCFGDRGLLFASGGCEDGQQLVNPGVRGGQAVSVGLRIGVRGVEGLGEAGDFAAGAVALLFGGAQLLASLRDLRADGVDLFPQPAVLRLGAFGPTGELRDLDAQPRL